MSNLTDTHNKYYTDNDESNFNEHNDIDEIEQQENEEDLNSESLKSISQVVVTSTDWTTETILNQLEKGNIQLSPKYQRRDAWSIEHKSRFIESLFLGLPIPQLILAEQKGKKGKYIVIDGKQRLLSLRQFSSKPDDEFNPLKLKGLEIKKELNGLTLKDIENNPLLFDDLTSFQNQTIRTVVVKNWVNEDFLFLLFLRLNTGSVKLSPQELRQALHPGPFIDYADEFSANSKILMNILKLKKPDFRMRDVEIVIRYFGFRNFINDYSGDVKSFLDMTCKKLNDKWEKGEDQIRSQADELELAINVTNTIFGEKHAFKKWNGNKFEGKFNRAVFDIMTFYFTDEEISTKAIEKKEIIVEKFKEVCASNRNFVASLETSTKSLSATIVRLSTWAQILKECLELNISIPQLIDGRITVV